MIIIECAFLFNTILRGYVGFSFFIFAFVKDRNKNVTINHEHIHFHQQVELLFVLHWILYILFFIINRFKGMSHMKAYRENVFEKEAYDNETDFSYHIKRRPYAWIKYFKHK